MKYSIYSELLLLRNDVHLAQLNSFFFSVWFKCFSWIFFSFLDSFIHSTIQSFSDSLVGGLVYSRTHMQGYVKISEQEKNGNKNTNNKPKVHSYKVGLVPVWCSVLRWMANGLPLDRGSWDVWLKALAWPTPTPSRANGRGMLMVLLKLGEVLVMSCPGEHLGSVIHPWVPSILGSKLSLEMSDSTENADVLAPCMVLSRGKWVQMWVRFCLKTSPHMITWIFA